MKFRVQGIFKEMLLGSEKDPSIYDYMQTKASENEDKIVNYLNSGIVVVACGGVMEDVINPENGLAGCPDLKTDGYWVWPGDLAYYVSKYHIKMHPEFVETMRNREWKIQFELPPDIEDIELIQ